MSERRYAKIVATGSYLPERVLTNDHLAKMVDTSDQWIVERTGIHRRHVVTGDEGALSMAVAAARDCLAEVPSSVVAQVGMVIVATCTSDYIFPGVACGVQSALGLNARAVPALDVSAACAGFVYALDLADQYIRTGKIGAALVIGSDCMSSIVDWQDRSTCVLFADGAAAVLLQAANEPGIIGTSLHADGGYVDMLYAKRRPAVPVTMRGNATFKLAVTKLSEVLEELLAESGVTKDELYWLVPHQANIRIIEATARRVGMSLDRVILTLMEQGNTSAASVPLALDSGIKSGKIKRGDTLLLDAFGGGMTWGASLIRY